MNEKTNYFKIGAFTLASITLVIVFIILLGIGNVFKQRIFAETYFDDTVQGLDIGSPVKYRGVTIGKVTAINLVNDIYGSESLSSNKLQRYIYVKFSLTQEIDHSITNLKDAKKTIHGYVAKGLRASLATQDLVGNVFLSLNFVDDPKKSPILPVSWKPKNIYIPSTPSTLSQLTDDVIHIAKNLNEINFEKVVNDIDRLTLSLDKSVKDAQLDKLGKKLNDALSETNQAIQQINDISSRTNLYITAQQKNWDSTFDTLHQMSLDLTSMSSTLKNSPSEIIFGQPTQPMDPAK